MKMILTGDWHLTDKKPENRIDDYESTCLRKLQFILDTAKKEGAELIIQPGDFTDNPNLSYSMFVKVVRLIKLNQIHIATIFGQHDLRYRNKSNSALLAIKAACPNLLLDINEYFQKPVFIHSAGWEDPIPKPLLKAFNVLITHRMIVETKLWEDQEDFEYGSSFLKQNRFELIISGDNHKYLHSEYEGRNLFNCGSLLRSNITQVNYQPRIILFDTETRDWKAITIPINPAEEVFKMEQILKTKEHDGLLKSFVEGLSTHKEMGLSFEDNLKSYMEANNIEPSVQSIIKENMI